MKISEWEVEELYDYIEPMWEEKEYFTWHKYKCKNCMEWRQVIILICIVLIAVLL